MIRKRISPRESPTAFSTEGKLGTPIVALPNLPAVRYTAITSSGAESLPFAFFSCFV
jgi:hypothetical protein